MQLYTNGNLRRHVWDIVLHCLTQGTIPLGRRYGRVGKQLLGFQASTILKS